MSSDRLQFFITRFLIGRVILHLSQHFFAELIGFNDSEQISIEFTRQHHTKSCKRIETQVYSVLEHCDTTFSDVWGSYGQFPWYLIPDRGLPQSKTY